ncbi:hypothetical protein MY1884_001948 [Beauveria asiatica]
MLVQTLLTAVAAATLALAGSPVENGNWIEEHPGFNTQQCEGGQVSGDTFSIPKKPNGHGGGSAPIQQRYSSGTHQFGGVFKINSMSGNRISIKQTFNGNSGPYFIMGVEQGGRLYSVEGGKTIAEGVAKVGASVRINTVHNVSLKRFSVYVNGKEMFRDDNAPGGSFYDKIGAYTTNSGSGNLSITWSDVQLWHRG